MDLARELDAIAAAAADFAGPGERVAGVLAAEPRPGVRAYVCALAADGGDRPVGWIVLDERGRAVRTRALVRDAVSIAAMCEIAAETAGGGDLEALRAQLVALRLREDPPGIEEAEEAAHALEAALGAPPRVATAGYLDAVGSAARRLERALGNETAPLFARAMSEAVATVQALADEVERGYRRTLDVSD